MAPTWALQGIAVPGAADFDDLLAGPPPPASLAYLWTWFAELHAGRTVTGLGYSRATHLDMWAWQQNAGIRAEPWEIRALTTLGSLWVEVMSDEQADDE